MNATALPLLKYQLRYLEDKSRFKIAMFARQTGKTFTTTLEIVDDCFEAWSAGGRTKWVILSRGERQAREAIEACKQHAKAFQLWIGHEIEISEEDWSPDDNPKVIYKKLEIELPGGHSIWLARRVF